MREAEYRDLARDIIKRANGAWSRRRECTISEGDQFSVNVRMGEIESLTEAGSRGAGLRVLIGKRTGSAYTSDLTDDGLDQMVDSALDGRDHHDGRSVCGIARRVRSRD